MNGDNVDKTQRLYKTELCRNWQETEQCSYGKKCCFAHGLKDLKTVQRHFLYKTRICRTYHLTGTCLYGTRCTFIHQDDPMNHPTSFMIQPSTNSNLTTKMPSPSPSTSSSTSSLSSSLSSSPILPFAPCLKSSFIEKEGTHHVLPHSSSWLAVTNPGFSSIWLNTCYQDAPVTKQGGKIHSSFSDWSLCGSSYWSP
ncbi:hypothetical protein BC941DRAFT_403318 [Chlamydoabsidia padenii]|nr:hypothetical protein BC941DRAFT_403318 [Chlamydoabsidia padenii]